MMRSSKLDLTRVGQGLEQQLGAADARVEGIAVQQRLERALLRDVGEPRQQGRCELVAPLQRPVELGAAALGQPFCGHGQGHGSEHQGHAPQQGAPVDGRRRGAPQPPEQAHDAEQHQGNADREVRDAEDGQASGPDDRDRPEGQGQEAEQAEPRMPVEPRHQPATRRQSKERRARAAATSAVPAK